MINGLSLFTGIGGLDVALSDYVRPIAYCEIDLYCQKILLSRMATGDLVHAPIWDDIKTLRFRNQEIDIDIIYAGFPCQDISIAGHGKGLEGERSGLFFEILRLAKEIQPTFIFLENVPAITIRGGLQIVKSIAEMGYDCRWCVVSAANVGAKHKRERWFLLAHSQSERCKTWRQPLRKKTSISMFSNKTQYAIWDKEPKNKLELARMVNGVQARMDRARALGNAVVPAQAKKAFEILMGINE